MGLLRSTLNRLLSLVLLFCFSSVSLFSLTQSEKETFQKILDEYKTSISNLVIQVENLDKTHQLSESQRQILQKRVQILQQQVVSLQTQVEKLNNQSLTLTQQSETLTKRNQTLTEDLQTLEAQLKELTKAIETLKNDLRGIEFENFMLKSGLVITSGLAGVFAFLYITKK